MHFRRRLVFVQLALLPNLFGGAWCIAADDNVQDQSVGGSIQLNVPNNAEPVQIQFQTSPISDIDQTPEQSIDDINTVTNAVVESGNEDPAEARTAIIYQAEGETVTIPSRFKKLRYQIITIPKRLINAWKESYSPPTARDWAIGTIFFTTSKMLLTGMVWFSSPKVPPTTALAFTVALGAVTILNNVYHTTLANFFSRGLSNPGRSFFNKDRFSIIGRSAAFDYVVSILLNAVGGWRNNIGLLTGDAIVNSGTNISLQSQKIVMFAGRRNLNLSYGFLLLPITTVIQAINSTGHLAPIWQCAFYTIRPTTIATLSLYAILITLNFTVPDKVLKVVSWVDRRLSVAFDASTNAVVKLIAKVRGTTCNDILDGKKAEPNPPTENNHSDELIGIEKMADVLHGQ